MDDRCALEAGTELCLQEVNDLSENWYRFRILNTVGRGATCITYNAIKYGSFQTEHLVRLKECFPYFGCCLTRDQQNRILVLQGEEEWLEKKRQFEETYKNHASIQKELGLTNSSAEVSELLKGNHTLYMVIKFDEGKDYAQISDETVADTLTVARAIAQVLEIYHKKGYLYLDLKPENVLILPETKEHIKLLDFDSVIEKKWLVAKAHTETQNPYQVQNLYQAQNLRQERQMESEPQMEHQLEHQLVLGGTQGYSAPEQLNGKIERISECADIYSVGAVVFAKLMGRTAEGKDGKYHVRYDFEPIKRNHKNLQPNFFKKLGEFFQKTLSISVENRFQSMEEVREKLKELISFADESGKFVLDNFIYHQTGFIGRKQELKEIAEHLKEHTLLFLHGIGGIGKSELAKQYAERNRGIYRTIVFANFQNSIFETVCSEEIRIANLERGEGESEREYFSRKIRVMQESLQPEDLLILDNFDVTLDADLEVLIRCNCHMLITSREDFLDWDFPQIEVQEIKQMEDLLGLFCSYQRETDWYREEEWKAVNKLIQWTDCHTMTIVLMAKYLRISGNSPCEYWRKLQSIAGILQTGSEEVKHRKDNRMTIASVEKHLQTIFDLSDITEQGKLVLRSLSLFGNTRIQKNIFLLWCKDAEAKTIEILSDSGWILYDKQTGKIALHQIILDMVYANFMPDSENCASVTEAVTKLMEQEWNSRMERNTVKRLIKIVAERISGNSQRLVRFYLNYCKWIGGKREYLEFCISYCQEHGLKKELSEAYCYYAELLWGELTEQCFNMEPEEQCKIAEKVTEFFEKAIEALEEKTTFIIEKIEKLLDDSEFFRIEEPAK